MEVEGSREGCKGSRVVSVRRESNRGLVLLEEERAKVIWGTVRVRRGRPARWRDEASARESERGSSGRESDEDVRGGHCGRGDGGVHPPLPRVDVRSGCLSLSPGRTRW